MKLLDHLKALSAYERGRLAERCGTTVDYLFQLGYGNRTPKVALAVAIERETAGPNQVRCEELLPEVDWAYLRTSASSERETERATP